MNSPSLRAPRTLLPWLWLALAGVAVWWHAGILLPFVISLVVAYVVEPAVGRLVRWRLPRPLAVALCLLLMLLTVSVLVALLVPIVSQLVPMVRAQLPDVLVALWKQWAPWLQQHGLVVPTSVDAVKAEVAELFQSHAAEWGAALWRSLLVGGSGLVSVAGLALLVPMLAFYWLLDWRHLNELGTGVLPPRWRPHAEALRDEMDALMGQYLRGQLLVMLILAAYYSVALTMAGFRLALPIGVFTGLAVCIPYLGFGLGLLLALVAGLLQFGAEGVSQPLLAVAVVYGIGQVFESFLLTPRLVGERIGLHPLGVILALMLFAQWFGFWGVLMALPCAACITVLGRHLWRHYVGSDFYRSA